MLVAILQQTGKKLARAFAPSSKPRSVTSPKKPKPAKAAGRATEDANWRQREAKRLIDGTYKPLPWDLPPIPDHYAHISTQAPHLVSYTVDERKGSRDIQTPIKPGKYLTAFYPKLGDAKINELAAAVSCNVVGLYFAKTQKDMVKVYRKGPRSCISGLGARMSRIRYYYGYSSKYEVAYITNALGMITGRAIVYPDRRVYTGVYGDRNKMRAKLKAAGFSGY